MRERSPSRPAGTCGRLSQQARHFHPGNTRSAQPTHRAQTGSPAAFIDQIFDLEPTQRQLVSFAKTSQSLGNLRHRGVSGRLFHALFQQRAQQPRNAVILPRSLDSSPLGDVLFEGDGYIAEAIDWHENSVTRKSCPPSHEAIKPWQLSILSSLSIIDR